MANPDVCIAGGGIIGLSLARALAQAGLSVQVLTIAAPMADASQAAAGMLAVEDPDNPPEMLALSRLSRSLYPRFLEELAEDSGHRVAFQTERTLQVVASALPDPASSLAWHDETSGQLIRVGRSERLLQLEEHSLDPRELAAALLASLPATGVELRTHVGVRHVGACAGSAGGVTIETAAGKLHAGAFVDCTGAWSLSTSLMPALRITPRKGQMLTVKTPPSLAAARTVIRSHAVYMVPRFHGQRAGQCVIGATVEDVGFDTLVHARDLTRLQRHAAALLPELASAEIVASWAGLRPATKDLLPVLGPLGDEKQARCRLWIASGHYRNGILLAPATAAVMAELLLGREPPVPLTAFSPARFSHPRA